VPILPGMLNPGCCCNEPAFDCEDRDKVLDDILAVPLGDYTANFAGDATMYAVQEPDEEVYPECGTGPNAKCWSYDCCIACGGNNDTCNEFNCYKHEIRNRRECFVVSNGVVAQRVFNMAGTGGLECACIGNPPPCVTCTGFTGCSFTNDGFDSLTAPAGYLCSPLIYACPTAGGFGGRSYDLAFKVQTSTSGDTTTKTQKRLQLKSFQRTVGGVTTCHLSLSLSFCVSSNKPFTPVDDCSPFTDGFVQRVGYFREWNGTDDAATFLGRELFLQSLIWSYNLCPFDRVNDDPNYCVYRDNFVTSDCGSVSVPYPCDNCTPRQLDHVYDLYTPTFGGTSTACDVAMDPVIDADFQPWRSVPATITVT